MTIDPRVKPVQQPVRRVPIAVEEKVENKLNEALARDIIEKVMQPSPWISPMVIVFKPDGDIRICIDMRRANEAILRENFPLPTFDGVMTKLRGAQYFSRLDMSNAYHQLELEENSRQITTFITHLGLLRFKRLMFGVNSAPEIFQRIFQNLLAPCPNCLNYLDDIIVYGKTDVEHDARLRKVLHTLKELNVLLNQSKCQFKVQKLEFLGHILTSAGISPDPTKIQVVRNFRSLTNKEELRSFLDLVTYLGKFIPNLGDLTEPLRTLIKADTQFTWKPIHQENFEKLKETLSQLTTLAFFDPNLRTRMIAGASPVALGAVLLQFNKDNLAQIISFASKSLSPIERRYSQTEKESLALVWAVERFYFYLAGLHFELETDHKPLETIFKPTSKPPVRIERWVLRLQAFKFQVIYKPGKSSIADPLSRLCTLQSDATFDEPNQHHIYFLVKEAVPKALTISDLAKSCEADNEIKETIITILDNSWDTKGKNSPFYPFRLEFTTLGPFLLRGNKIVIPSDLRLHTLRLAHEGHPGESVMKRRFWSKVWWPQIDRDAEKFVKSCRECLLVSQPNRPSPMERQKLPSGPWQFVAIDYMSAGQSEYLLVIIDYYSRYAEAFFTKSTTSSTVIKFLQEIFARLGIPKTLKADNATNFNSEEFKASCYTNGIKLINSAPYWPQANGEVENFNKALKKHVSKYATQKRIRTTRKKFRTSS